ncbi:MAG: MaoC family dehydratase N-terminal domain-containing protein [Chloroflexota bacterium]|nr:MaoC family dehydratase N-terminal domain-containing protein [Chloroflexota bacterium]
MSRQAESVLTPEIKALIGEKGEMVEGWGVVDEEYLRRFVQALPDWDPTYWDAEFARKTRFKARTVPPVMVTYMAGRRPLEEWSPVEGRPEVERGSLPRIPTKLDRHLHGGDAVEVFQYPKLGDSVCYQRRYADIQERVGGDGKPFLVIIAETTYWNQKNEVLCKVRSTYINR